MVKQIKTRSNNCKNVQNNDQNIQKKLVKVDKVSKGVKYLKFFSFLKHLHQRIGKQQLKQPYNQVDLTQITKQLMIFFNLVKKYTQNQLNISIICLANLFAFIRNDVNNLQFQKEFKNKLKHFLPTLQNQQEDCIENYNSKITAVFYILAVLIYKQRLTQSQHIKDLNNAIYSDSSLVKYLLNITIIPEVRLSKFYGIVLHYVSSKVYSKKQKEILIKSLILNLKNIKNESTLMNLLVYLRLQKNKIRINLQDVQKGQIISFLKNLYPKYIQKHQAEYILDYLHHLVVLFPQIYSKYITSQFLAFLIETTDSQHYHPLQEKSLVSLISYSLNFINKTQKDSFLDFCTKFVLKKNTFSVKLLEIIIDYDINFQTLLIIIQNDFFDKVLQSIKRQNDNLSIVKTIKMSQKIIRKVQKTNHTIANYLSFQLSLKLKIMRQKQINGKKLIQFLTNTHHQY